MFSLGISFFEICADVVLPENGHMWHQLRDGSAPPLPSRCSNDLNNLVQSLMIPNIRPAAKDVLRNPRIKRLLESTPIPSSPPKSGSFTSKGTPGTCESTKSDRMSDVETAAGTNALKSLADL